MNRRGLLALLGGAAAMPSVGVNAAASALGIGSGPIGPDLIAGEGGNIPGSNGWWGSPLQIAFDAKERASYRLERGDGYPHMKSWGRAFRQSQVERDELLMSMYRRKMESDASFYGAVMSTLGVKG